MESTTHSTIEKCDDGLGVYWVVQFAGRGESPIIEEVEGRFLYGTASDPDWAKGDWSTLKLAADALCDAHGRPRTR